MINGKEKYQLEISNLEPSFQKHPNYKETDHWKGLFNVIARVNVTNYSTPSFELNLEYQDQTGSHQLLVAKTKTRNRQYEFLANQVFAQVSGKIKNARLILACDQHIDRYKCETLFEACT